MKKNPPIFYLDHGIGLENLICFAKKRGLDYKNLQKGFCRAVSCLHLANHLVFFSALKAPSRTVSLMREIVSNSQIVNQVVDWKHVDVQADKNPIVSAHQNLYDLISFLQEPHIVQTKNGLINRGSTTIASLLIYLNLDPNILSISGGEVFICKGLDFLRKISVSLFDSEFVYIIGDPVNDEFKENAAGHAVFVRKTATGQYEFYDANLREKKSASSFEQLAEFIYNAYQFIKPVIIETYRINPIRTAEISVEHKQEELLDEKEFSAHDFSLMAVHAASNGELDYAKNCLKKGVLISVILRVSAFFDFYISLKEILKECKKNPEYFKPGEIGHDYNMSKGLLISVVHRDLDLWNEYVVSGADEEKTLYGLFSEKFCTKSQAEKTIPFWLDIFKDNSAFSNKIINFFSNSALEKLIDPKNLLKNYISFLDSLIALDKSRAMETVLSAIIQLKYGVLIPNNQENFILKAVASLGTYNDTHLLNKILGWSVMDEDRLEVTKAAVKVGANINYVNEEKQSLVYVAIEGQNLELAKWLILNKAIVDNRTLALLREYAFEEQPGNMYEKLIEMASQMSKVFEEKTTLTKGGVFAQTPIEVGATTSQPLLLNVG